VTKFSRPATSLVTFRLTKLTKLAGAPAAGHEKTTELIGGLSVANRNVCRTAPNESVAGSGRLIVQRHVPASSSNLGKLHQSQVYSRKTSQPEGGDLRFSLKISPPSQRLFAFADFS